MPDSAGAVQVARPDVINIDQISAGVNLNFKNYKKYFSLLKLKFDLFRLPAINVFLSGAFFDGNKLY